MSDYYGVTEKEKELNNKFNIECNKCLSKGVEINYTRDEISYMEIADTKISIKCTDCGNEVEL